MAGSKWTYPYARRQRKASRYTFAILTWVGDRVATATLDTGPKVDVVVPNGLWVFPGNRVALFRYPDAWTVVGGVTQQPHLLARRGDR
jgi:hypothetical protein